MDRNYATKVKAGFTLAEILLAMMVFAIAITTILGLLARSIETADTILVKDEAITLSSALDSAMSEMDFDTAYDQVRQGGHLYAYHYRADPENTNSDGTLRAFTNITGSSMIGEDYVVVPGVRLSGDSLLAADMNALDGRLFYVELSESDANPYTIQNGKGNLPADPDAAGSNGYPAYDSAVIVVFAEFYEVSNTTNPPAGSANPVFSFNFAVRR
ncbi:prepilin-type N-terminal cleavage/methylation domain-containing protein [Kiritimatiellaeota bacterium B1221]|nr:prepilin-type N-terminal cleavage/methylation domain-containing protein [Kiritimatiellaeota bacterium B1221]